MSVFSSGPLFVVVGRAGQLRALGTSESGVDVESDISYYPIMNDVAGPIKPLDKGYAGENGTLSMTLTSWDQVTLSMVEAKINENGALNGQDRRADRGRLMLTGNLSWPVYLVHGHRDDPVMIAQNMPRGRVYFHCQPRTVRVMRGRRANRVALTWEWEEKYDNASGKFIGWSENQADIRPAEQVPFIV